VTWFGWKKLSVRGRVFVGTVTVVLIATIAVGLAVGLMVPRYFTRIYGPTIVTCFICGEAIIAASKTAANQRWAAIGASAFVITAVLQNVWRLPIYVLASHNN
jgi:hypothetical protein